MRHNLLSTFISLFLLTPRRGNALQAPKPLNPKLNDARYSSVSSIIKSETRVKLASSSTTSLFSQVTTEELDKSYEKKAKEDRRAMIKSQGGKFAFDTKYGALNPYAIYSGTAASLLGLVWYIEMMLCRLFYFITRNKIDSKRYIPMLFSLAWGRMVMVVTGLFPEVENRKALKKIKNRGAMFVANHNAWHDILCIGHIIGWQNFKFVAKKELLKVPMLGSSMKAGRHVIVDRENRRSQFYTLKSGMEWLKKGVHLITFPEGTRSENGKLQPFKNGAFKMAYKVGAPIVPISICGAHTINPKWWMFPNQPARGLVKVVIHDPIEVEGMTEEEFGAAARNAIISGLPADQRPDAV